jgi:hypothetical protein
MVFEAIHQYRAIILFGEPCHVIYRLSFVGHASLSASAVVYVLSLELWPPHYVDSLVLCQEETIRQNVYLSMEKISSALNYDKLSGLAKKENIIIWMYVTVQSVFFNVMTSRIAQYFVF